jgi:farnesyl diphosphate synthase
MATAKLLELDQFSWKQYEFIAVQKIAFYTIYLPIAIPLVYLNLAKPENLDQG